MIEPSVEVASDTPEAAAAIARWGVLFWERRISGGGVMLIPLHDGVPRVADFIIVPSSALRAVGWTKAQGDKAQREAAEAAQKDQFNVC